MDSPGVDKRTISGAFHWERKLRGTRYCKNTHSQKRCRAIRLVRISVNGQCRQTVIRPNLQARPCWCLLSFNHSDMIWGVCDKWIRRFRCILPEWRYRFTQRQLRLKIACSVLIGLRFCQFCHVIIIRGCWRGNYYCLVACETSSSPLKKIWALPCLITKLP